ncbi:lysophospholipid acyltransferase family protein [Paracraurococcus lichenis]|uniref:Lysophospholipid acyltransferase family protein n=1 Tax=Paracraurococcus lichenis TaxID=3064888 RepID=A0ABT9E288_9PROT|nr:lysophospholipid acyltransferase family protein [Paracraurococcus sp. LOR1-02]MDO9710202.1 lysophospholipid acyltransferase family protein [Paracraurococcus sp. LOR1-02]
MFRRLIRSDAAQGLFAWLLGLYLAGVYRTTRWTLVGEANLRAALTDPAGGHRPVIGAFWHERLPMMPRLWLEALRRVPGMAGRRGHVLVSRHRDGRFIGEVVRRFRLEMVHASTSRGGATGMRVLLRLLAAGDTIVITPDGPRGPRRIAAPGVAQLAAVSGLPVLPCAARTTRARLLPSWDRMVLPLPFGQGVLVVGPPLAVERDDPLAALPAIEAALTAACDTADRWALAPAATRAAMA